MSWAKIDDRFHDDPKVLRAGNAATGLFARALSYAADHLTNGYVPNEWVIRASKPRERQSLVEAGMWVPAHDGDVFIIETHTNERVEVTISSDGYFIPKYLQFNPTDEKVREERGKTAKRVQEYRARKRASDGNGDGNAVTAESRNGGGNAVTGADVTPLVTGGVTGPPSRPVPDPSRDDGSNVGETQNDHYASTLTAEQLRERDSSFTGSEFAETDAGREPPAPLQAVGRSRHIDPSQAFEAIKRRQAALDGEEAA